MRFKDSVWASFGTSTTSSSAASSFSTTTMTTWCSTAPSITTTTTTTTTWCSMAASITMTTINNEKVEYLGLVIEEGRVSTDPVKVKGFADWPTPKCVKNVQWFLGFGNFYWKFIPKFSTLAAPLNNLLKKDTAFEWTEETQLAFEELKQQLTSAPVLMMPDQTKPFHIECNASRYTSGAVLTQLVNNRDWHPIAFLSKTFDEMKHNYEIYDRELLAIIWVLEEWRHYIQGLGHTTIIYSDHQNLTFFRSAQKLNWRQAQWSLYLSEFDVKLLHQPGSKMIQSNALSQGPNLIPDQDTDNQNLTLLPEHLSLNLLDVTLQDRILGLGQIDDFLTTFSITDPPFGAAEDWKLEAIDGKNTLFHKGRNYIPSDLNLWWDILVRPRHWYQWSDITGGLAYTCSYKTMWRVVASVNNLRLIGSSA